MARFGYGTVQDRGFVGFEQELEDGPWKDVVTKKFEEGAKESAATLLLAPQSVVWKLRLRRGIGAVLTALGATSLAALDASWDSKQRRLFHRLGAGADDEDRTVRDAADRLAAQLLLGGGTKQTQLDLDDEVDFGRKQVALTQPGGALATDVKKLKLESTMADVAKATEALAAGLGRRSGEKRKAPSKILRDAMAECAAAFNAVHDQLGWFIDHTPQGAERDKLTRLLAPLEALLERAATPEAAQTAASAQPTPAPPPADAPADAPKKPA